MFLSLCIKYKKKLVKIKILLFHVILMLTKLLSAQSPSSWSSRGVGGGGALFSPSINPSNDNEYYFACDMSELFHTTDFGLTYDQVHFSKIQAGISSKIVFT